MFGAFNRLLSRLDGDATYPKANEESPPSFGFQVLRNSGSLVAVDPWFDFVVGINGRQIEDGNAHLFSQEIRNCSGSNLSLTVWSAKGQRTRLLQIQVPNTPPPSLGLSLQWTPLNCTEEVWHILDVTANSPAEQAGLLPYGDYIIGSPEGVVRGESALQELVEDRILKHLSRPLRLHIYNHEYNVTRELTIHPSRSWGGAGALGCTLGYGALHRLPSPLDEPPQAPGETLFSSQEASQGTSSHEPTQPLAAGSEASSALDDAEKLSKQEPAQPFIPAARFTTAPYVTAVSSTQRKSRPARAAYHHSTNSKNDSAMDAYFLEGERKSREQDYVPATPRTINGNVTLPPPPRAKDSALAMGLGLGSVSIPHSPPQGKSGANEKKENGELASLPENGAEEEEEEEGEEEKKNE